MHKIKPTILISGYTAAGKTTHARLLAARWGYDYLGSSEVRRALVRSQRDWPSREWDPSIDLTRRRTLAADRELDELISEKIRGSASPLVVDAWLQPWLCSDTSAIRVWIESNTRSRVWKATVTFLRDAVAVPPDIDTQIAQKDEFSRWMFSRLYGIEFQPDPDVFDVILDNSHYIEQPTVEASDFGIAQFEPVLEQAIEEQCSRKHLSSQIAFCAQRKQEQPTSAGMTGRCG